MSNSPNEINNLEHLFSRLPGLGPRSARRIVLHLLKKKDTLMPSLASSLTIAMKNIVSCSLCGNIDIINPCSICTDPKRDNKIICVVEDVTDLWALQKVSSFRGLFHVLGGVLSALDGIGPSNLNIEQLIISKRNHLNNISEIDKELDGIYENISHIKNNYLDTINKLKNNMNFFDDSLDIIKSAKEEK